MGSPASSNDSLENAYNSQQIGPYDILCGRNKDSFRNIGNHRFRVTVSLFISQYENAEGRNDKAAVITSVLELINRVGGRFLKEKENESGDLVFEELTSKQAHEKVGHAIRDMSRALHDKQKKQKVKRARSYFVKSMSESFFYSGVGVTKQSPTPPSLAALQATCKISLGRKRTRRSIMSFQEQHCQQLQLDNNFAYPLVHTGSTEAISSPRTSQDMQIRVCGNSTKELGARPMRLVPLPLQDDDGDDCEPLPFCFSDDDHRGLGIDSRKQPVSDLKTNDGPSSLSLQDDEYDSEPIPLTLVCRTKPSCDIS